MSEVQTIVNCYHCGDPCDNGILKHKEKEFCCQGCLAVYDLLNSAGMATYYDSEEKPGIKIKNKHNFKYLDHPDIEQKMLLYSDATKSHIKIHLPSIHCSSCIWLLENISRLEPRIISSSVNYLKKETTIVFSKTLLLSELAALLEKIGYAPNFSLNDISASTGSAAKKTDYTLNYKLGVAGFCFGNIMLLGLPSYLGADFIHDIFYLRLFAGLQLALALPILLYVSTDYYKSAWYAIKSKSISIDIPLTLGIFVLFGRSVFEIFTDTGGGYLDSLSGLLFFMMIGKWFQQTTYENLVFDRDYKSYFPIAVTVINDGNEEAIPLEKLQPEDIILVRNGELIPCDGILLSENAQLDYSFVTGENESIYKKNNEHLFSGAKVKGEMIRIKVSKAVDQSYLTQLWNKDVFKKKDHDHLQTLLNKTSRYFTISILFITTATAVYWYFNDVSKIADAVTAILIITCPCAFALSSPFTLGNVLRFFGKNKYYLKDSTVVEKMAGVTDIVFDKTGTLTYLDKKNVIWNGSFLSDEEKAMIYSMVNNSTHPYSRSIAEHLKPFKSTIKPQNFIEHAGKGIEAMVNGQKIKIGSSSFAGNGDHKESSVHISFNDQSKGFFSFQQSFRTGTENILKDIKSNYRIHLLSGDKPSEIELFERNIPTHQIHFNQTPIQKLDYIQKLQSEGKKVCMIGDGLNDAGALAASDFGITITDDVNSFTPSSDAILDAKNLSSLPSLFRLSKESITIIKLSFLISFLYNAVGLSLAVTATLTPLFAAIFMPVSSITIIVFVTSMVNWRGNKKLQTFEKQ